MISTKLYSLDLYVKGRFLMISTKLYLLNNIIGTNIVIFMPFTFSLNAGKLNICPFG